jgi:hypothetical protein
MLRPSRLFVPGPGAPTGIPQVVQQPRHLTDEFGPSRFPTLKMTDQEEQAKKK